MMDHGVGHLETPWKILRMALGADRMTQFMPSRLARKIGRDHVVRAEDCSAIISVHPGSW